MIQQIHTVLFNDIAMTKEFDYEQGFMGVRDKKPDTYLRTFKEDYRLRSLVGALKLGKGRLLDIGCGGGMLTESLPYYYPKSSVYGCDISSTAISYAKKLGSGKIKYAVIKNKKLPYKSNFFDACICLDVLEHIPDVNYFLKEVKRILKKDGKFFLIIPCEGQQFTFTWFFNKIHLGQNLTLRYLGHIHPEFTHAYVISILRKHGFFLKKKTYSEHVFYQIMEFFTLFLPKIMLEVVFGGKKANEFTNSSLISSPKSKKDPLLIVRNLWYSLWNFMLYYPMNWETRVFRKTSLTAWKLHVLLEKEVLKDRDKNKS